MDSFWQPLVGNLAVVAFFISAFAHSRPAVRRLPRPARRVAFGVGMGVGTVTSMLMAVRLDGGGLLDLRLSLVALSSFFGGPVAGMVTAVIAIATRVAIGGATAWLAGFSILLAFGAGWGLYAATAKALAAMPGAILLAAAVGGISPLVSTVLSAAGLLTNMQAVPAQWFFNAAATVVSSLVMMQNRRMERERDLLRAAFAQSPDFQYVKGRDLRFVGVNDLVAAHYGFADPTKMTGLSDRELADPARVEQLLAQDRSVVDSGVPVINAEEVLPDRDGKPIYFETSKVAVRDEDGQVIGIAGVTRDVTANRQLEMALEDQRNQLSYMLAQMSDGVAMFGPAPERQLVYCNEQYRMLFPRTSDVRRPGNSLRQILREALARGEETIPGDMDQDQWIEQVVEREGTNGQRDITLADGRVIGMRSRGTADGGVLTVVGDVTEVRRAESAMREATEALRQLATTDGLTTLMNRRAFDTALNNEVLRARRDKTPLSLLLIDVDRFKAYNDLYGHQAGDDVLRRVGDCLKAVLQRPGDSAARYGGEEFAAILPNTDEDGAFFIADKFCAQLRGLAIMHAAADRGVVTASVGIATLEGGDTVESAAVLIKRADTALYDAKHAGRDRIMGFRPREELRRRA